MSRAIVHERRFNPVIAGVLSFFFPGLGQLYKGQLLRAILWFVFTGVGYWFFIVPGLILHVLCVAGAVFGSAGSERIRLPG
jgi:TM2 domain-containing membrane protein YozV